MIHMILLGLTLQFSSIVQRNDRNVQDRSIDVERAKTSWVKCLDYSVKNENETKSGVEAYIFSRCLNDQESYRSAMVTSYGDTPGLDAGYLADREIETYKKHFTKKLDASKK